MSSQSKKELLQEIRKRYFASSKKEKEIILNEFCATCKYNRKYAIRLINNGIDPFREKQKVGRKCIYETNGIIEFIFKLYISLNMVCSRRIKAAIPIWIKYSPVELTEIELELLLKISPSTIDRLLKKKRHQYNKIGLATTKPGSLIRKQIPILTNQWDESRPGFVEADTVAHCGTSIAGQFIYTVQIVDIATGWSESRGVWGKGEQGVFQAIQSIEAHLPFKIKGFDSDNGTEFLNNHLLKYFLEQKPSVNFTRSRPYHKNDNAHIEQKNWTNVRQHLGYQRFDNKEILPILNDLYVSEWSLYFNYFVPSMKLLSKQRVGSKIVKHHDRPKTPFIRLCESGVLSETEMIAISAKVKSINPFELQKTFRKRIIQIQNLTTVTT